MIDLFCIFTTGGLIIWSKAFVTSKFDVWINDLIKTILMDEKKTQDFYVPKNETGIILRWKVLNEAGLIFVVAYQQSFNILYSDILIDLVVQDFKINRLDNLNHNKNVYLDTPDAKAYNEVFMDILRKWEKMCQNQLKPKETNKGIERSETVNPSGTTPDFSEENIEISKLAHSKTVVDTGLTSSKIVIRKNQNRTPKNSSKKEKKSTKVGRSWDDNPRKVDDKLMNELDNSKKYNIAHTDEDKKIEQFKKQFLGAADPDNLNDKEFDETKSKGIFSKFTSTLKNYMGNKVLTEEDLKPVMDQLVSLLMEKNVAKEIAENLCLSVKKGLLNTKTDSFTTITTTVKNALKESIAKILTPKEELDILRQALAAKKRGEPYKIVFIGVNGVGKSTNLAKVGFMLKNNGLKILIAACDNFRSGAVEQLKTHSKALEVDLFEKGYKDDPAYICKEAIEEAKREGYDCVLIDTAGRMQDNEPLMRSLAKLVEINQPDAILFVGEALTGNDSVDQLQKFNQALIDYSKKDKPRTIDGCILTKFDTVDDKVGAALTMVYTTGKPIVYVGTGQKYYNLKKLNVNNVLNAIFG